MNRTKRTLTRVAGMALVLTGAASFAAGQASANDRAVVVSCSDQSAGTWTVLVTFSGIEVKVDHPVTVTLTPGGNATLTDVGPNGTVTLQHSFGGDQSSATLTWLVRRQDYQNTGVLDVQRPGDCQETPSTEAPPVTDVASTPVAITPSPEVAPTTVPATVLAVEVTPAKAAVAQALPETGRPAMPMLALGAGALVGGLGLVGVARRRPEKA